MKVNFRVILDIIHVFIRFRAHNNFIFYFYALVKKILTILCTKNGLHFISSQLLFIFVVSGPF